MLAATHGLGDQWETPYDEARVSEMQQQMQRYAAHRPGWPLLSAITGGVGAGTIALFKRMQADKLVSGLANIAPTRDGISASAAAIAGYLRFFGDANRWAPYDASINPPPAPVKTPSGGGSSSSLPTPTVDTSDALVVKPSFIDKYGYYLAAGVAGIGALWLARDHFAKTKKSSKQGIAGRRRRR